MSLTDPEAMAVLYERLYAEQFSRRTLLVAGHFLASFYALMIAIYVSSGKFDWLGWSFFVRYFFAALPFLAVLVARLRPTAKPEKMVGIFSNLNFWSILSWLFTNWVFVYFYFGEFAPSYLIKYTYPEGKYGPPLMKEQPFYLFAFAAFLAVFGYAKLVWRYKSAIVYHLEESPSFLDLVINRINKSMTRLGNILAFSFVATFIWSLIFMVPSYNLYAKWISFFHPVRRSTHSFWEFLDVRLFYHLFWMGVILLVLYTLVEVFVEYHFGCCFHICKGIRNSDVILLDGLKSPKPAIRNQALLELRFLLHNDSQWRETLFHDFVGEEAISRSLCRFFIRVIQEYSSHFMNINEDFKLFSERFAESAGTQRFSEEFKQENLTKTNAVFSPHRKNIVERILEPLSEDNSSKHSSSTFAGKTQKIPEILEVKPHSGEKHVHFMPAFKAETREQKRFRNKYLQLTLFVFGQFANTYPGKIYSSMACEMIKSWCLNQEEPIFWLLDSLTTLIVASYDEDIHGQVQFEINDILKSLAELVEQLNKFDLEPHINGRRMLDDLFGNSPSPTEKRTRELVDATINCLETILEKFGDSIGQLKLDPLTTTKLRVLGLNF